MSKSLFSPAELDKIITETLPPDAKPGEKVVVGAVNSDGASIVASFKLKEKWELQAAVKHSWGGDNQAGAKVILRW